MNQLLAGKTKTMLHPPVKTKIHRNGIELLGAKHWARMRFVLFILLTQEEYDQSLWLMRCVMVIVILHEANWFLLLQHFRYS